MRDSSPVAPDRPRLGLCCQFVRQPIRFRTTTAAALGRLPRRRQLARLAEICEHNAAALLAALEFCRAEGIGSFRIGSSLLPVRTHPVVGYDIRDLPGGDALVERFRRCGAFARAHGIRTGFHPDQFIVMNSPDREVVARSVADLVAHAGMAQWTHADTINIHAGGAYGDKRSALDRLERNLDRLPAAVRSRLTLENDDRTFTPSDLIPLCRRSGIPMVYDVHHHRCNPDGMDVRAATRAARATWDREPLFHVSSPIEGWTGARPERHHDYIDIADFPPEWIGLPVTVEVEAKAKELAVAKLRDDLQRRR